MMNKLHYPPTILLSIDIELHKKYKSWVPYKIISYLQLVYEFGHSNRNYSALPPN